VVGTANVISGIFGGFVKVASGLGNAT